MVRLVDMVVSLYALGLIAYLLFSWLKNTQTDKVRIWLGRFYEPVLVKMRASVKPVRMGAIMLDLTFAIFLVGLMVLKGMVVYFLPRGL
jgi:uncharacterized protein YggT (Ycf19 family)